MCYKPHTPSACCETSRACRGTSHTCCLTSDFCCQISHTYCEAPLAYCETPDAYRQTPRDINARLILYIITPLIINHYHYDTLLTLRSYAPCPFCSLRLIPGSGIALGGSPSAKAAQVRHPAREQFDGLLRRQ